MKGRARIILWSLLAAASGLFCAWAGWYLGRGRVPRWVRMYSRPSAAWAPEYGDIPSAPWVRP